jgi:hypothetical protein
MNGWAKFLDVVITLFLFFGIIGSVGVGLTLADDMGSRNTLDPAGIGVAVGGVFITLLIASTSKVLIHISKDIGNILEFKDMLRNTNMSKAYIQNSAPRPPVSQPIEEPKQLLCASCGCSNTADSLFCVSCGKAVNQ